MAVMMFFCMSGSAFAKTQTAALPIWWKLVKKILEWLSDKLF